MQLILVWQALYRNFQGWSIFCICVYIVKGHIPISLIISKETFVHYIVVKKKMKTRTMIYFLVLLFFGHTVARFNPPESIKCEFFQVKGPQPCEKLVYFQFSDFQIMSKLKNDKQNSHSWIMDSWIIKSRIVTAELWSAQLWKAKF